jgi:hypothetical protein
MLLTDARVSQAVSLVHQAINNSGGAVSYWKHAPILFCLSHRISTNSTSSYGSKIHQKENLHSDLYSIQNVLYEIEDDTFRTTPRSENQVTVSLGPCERKKEPRNSLCPRGYCSANACQDRNRSNSVKLSREAENFDNLLHNHLSMF